MPNQIITLTFNTVNASAQVGDIVYYTTGGSNVGGFNNASLANTVKLGPIVSITPTTINVEHDPAVVPAPGIGAFISFVKDPTVNTSSLVGYYASVNFVNDSTNKIELFSVGSEISESSK